MKLDVAEVLTGEGPLPLGRSDAARHGFKGMFVASGARKPGSNPDPVMRERDWWRAPPGF